MKFSLALLSVLPAAICAQTNNTNGIGSTPSQRFIVSSTQAQSIITAAVANATAEDIPQNIAVVDPSGLLVAFLRMDNALIGSIDVSTKKARTAVLFNGIPSGGFYSSVQPGAPLYGIESTNGGLIVFGGGFPIYLDGKLIGGVGVSGGSVDQDVRVSTAGVLAIGATTSL
ncbi:DUF336-domain-containing protein [Plenodomus tracheiphilus IPT5]|uniref:DUF336-domain-containing protein n=1 Tax=Plenodomus tracheiphilus IPT5 TaxID=1408161 RepID=A0A6A7B9I7_9PLEO|nr:DUF336-domain-containing protein [Plenodomus tracheiphilus IPT5]